MYETFEMQSEDVRRFARSKDWNGLEIGVRHFARFAPELAKSVDSIIPSASDAMHQLANIGEGNMSREYITDTIGKFEYLRTDLSRKRYDRKPFINMTRRSVDQILKALYPLEQMAPMTPMTPPTTCAYQDHAVNYDALPADENMLRIRG